MKDTVKRGSVLMGKAMRLGVLGTLAVAGALALLSGPAMAAPLAYTCTGGEILSGTYASITVTGTCSVQPDGVISVVGNVNVAAGATLDAQNAPSTIAIGGTVTAAQGSILGLGCQPVSSIGRFAGVPCTVEPTGHTTITVNGNITATNTNTVLLRGITVNGNVTLTGGGGVIPWAIKGNTIGGNLTVSGVTADWLGVLFNVIGGNATLTSITATDPGDPGRTVSVASNTIGRNLNCTGLAPGVSGGFTSGEVNVVGGKATGQCASLI